jgi:hypothetical protein
VDFLQLLCILFLQNIEYVWIYNKLCVTLNIVIYELLGHVGITIVCKQPNVQVIEFDPTTFLLQHIIQCYKQVNTKHLRKERKNVSYQSLGLAGVTIHPIVVHCRLALSVVLVLL